MTRLLPELVPGSRITRQNLTPLHPLLHLQGDYFTTRGNSPFVRSFTPSPQLHPHSSLIRELLVWVLPPNWFESLPAGGVRTASPLASLLI